MEPAQHAELYTLVDNSFQDLQSNCAIISAKSNQLEQNGSLLKSEEGDWEYIGEKVGVKRFKKVQPSNPNIIIIGGTGIVHSPPKYAYKAVSDLTRLKEWSSALEEARIIKEMDNNITELYLGIRGKFPVAGRDFHVMVGKRTMREPENHHSTSKRSFKRSYLITVTSIQSNSNIPEVSGKVRGTLYPSGFIIKPLQVNGFQQPCSQVTYIAQIDLKGWIPSLITNLITNYSPLPMVKTFIPSSLTLSHDNPVVPYEKDEEELEDEREAQAEEIKEAISQAAPSVSPTKKQPIVEDDDVRKMDLITVPSAGSLQSPLSPRHRVRVDFPSDDTESLSSLSDLDEEFFDPDNDFDEITTTTTTVHHHHPQNNDHTTNVQNNHINHPVHYQIEQLQSMVGHMNRSIATLEQTINKVRTMIQHEEQSKQRQQQLEGSINRLTDRITAIEQKIDRYYSVRGNPSSALISSPFSLLASSASWLFEGVNSSLQTVIQWITSERGRKVTKTSTMVFVLVLVWPVISWKVYGALKDFANNSNRPTVSDLFASLGKRFT